MNETIARDQGLLIRFRITFERSQLSVMATQGGHPSKLAG